MSDDAAFLLEIEDLYPNRPGDFTIADGVMNTANRGWITCTPENILMYDMVRQSGMTEETFEALVSKAFAAGYIPKMLIEKKEPQNDVDPGKFA